MVLFGDKLLEEESNSKTGCKSLFVVESVSSGISRAFFWPVSVFSTAFVAFGLGDADGEFL